MRASATKKRRRRAPRKADVIGKEAWQVVAPDGSVLVETSNGPDVALVKAQGEAQKMGKPEEPVVLVVRLKPLFGPTDEVFRVVLEEDGSVSTYRA